MIALPSYLHAPAVLQAANAGVGIFCEKPMALNAADCRRMIAAARDRGVALMVGHVMRYYEPYRSILRWQAEARFGRLFAASIWRFFDGRRMAVKGGWQASRDKSGGYLFEIGIHELDMLRCLMGRPASAPGRASSCRASTRWRITSLYRSASRRAIWPCTRAARAPLWDGMAFASTLRGPR